MRLNSHFTKLLRSFVAPFIGVEPLSNLLLEYESSLRQRSRVACLAWKLTSPQGEFVAVFGPRPAPSDEWSCPRFFDNSNLHTPPWLLHKEASLQDESAIFLSSDSSVSAFSAPSLHLADKNHDRTCGKCNAFAHNQHKIGR